MTHFNIYIYIIYNISEDIFYTRSIIFIEDVIWKRNLANLFIDDYVFRRRGAGTTLAGGLVLTVLQSNIHNHILRSLKMEAIFNFGLHVNTTAELYAIQDNILFVLVLKGLEIHIIDGSHSCGVDDHSAF